MEQAEEESNILEFPAGVTVVKADTEQGYTRIANTLLDAICQTELTARQFRSMLAVIRKTYGFNRKTDWITASQVAEEINYSGDVSNIRKDIKALKSRKILLEDGRKVGPNPTVSDWIIAKQVENNTGRKQPANRSKTTPQQVENNPPNRSKTTPTKDNSKDNKKDSTKNKASVYTLPDWVDKSLFADYVEMRKKIKSPMTERAVKIAVNKLSEIMDQGFSQQEVIELAIVSGWKSFYPPKKQKSTNQKTSNNASEIQAWLDDEGAQ